MSLSTPINRPAASPALWASAFVILAVLIFQAGRINNNPAQAEMVSRVGEYTLMTTDGGNEEVIVVIDNRNEDLLIYKVLQQKELNLFQKIDLDRLFADAKRAAGSRR